MGMKSGASKGAQQFQKSCNFPDNSRRIKPWFCDLKVVSNVLRFVEDSEDLKSFSLVCRTWFFAHSRSKTSIAVKSWDFVESCRILDRFPNLMEIDVTQAWNSTDEYSNGPPVLISSGSFSSSVNVKENAKRKISDEFAMVAAFIKGMQMIAEMYPNLQRLAIVDVSFQQKKSPQKILRNSTQGSVLPLNGSTRLNIKLTSHEYGPQLEPSDGILEVAEKCQYLQELKVRRCSDSTLFSIGKFKNLHILNLAGVPTIGAKESATFTDLGLQALAASCQRLVELKIAAGAVGYEGLSAIGKKCEILTKLTLSNKMFRKGWLQALHHFRVLETLVFDSCHKIDSAQYSPQLLGVCQFVDNLRFKKCDLGDKDGFRNLLKICSSTTKLEFQDCWRFSDDVFMQTGSLRCLQSLKLEGCSLITSNALSTVLKKCQLLLQLSVTFCEKIEDASTDRALKDRLSQMSDVCWKPQLGCFQLKTGSHFNPSPIDPIASFNSLQEAIDSNLSKLWGV